MLLLLLAAAAALPQEKTHVQTEGGQETNVQEDNHQKVPSTGPSVVIEKHISIESSEETLNQYYSLEWTTCNS